MRSVSFRLRTLRDLPVPAFLATYRFSLHFPVSITNFTPGIVIEVSAMFVARMHLRIPGGVGAKIFACWAGGSDAYSGHVSTWMARALPSAIGAAEGGWHDIL